MSQQSQIGTNLKEEIILHLWDGIVKLLYAKKNRKRYVDTLLTHGRKGTFPTNFRCLEYKQLVQFPKSFTQQTIDTYNEQLKQQHENLKRFTLDCTIEAYSSDLNALEKEIEKVFGQEHISEVLKQKFGILAEQHDAIIQNIRLELNIKKNLFLNDRMDLSQEIHSRATNTTIDVPLTNPDTFLPFPLTQLSQHVNSPARFPVFKKRTLEQDNDNDDQLPPSTQMDTTSDPSVQQPPQVDLMETIQKMAAQLTSLQIQLDNQNPKNVAGPRQAHGHWTGERSGGQQSSNSNRSGSNNSRNSRTNQSNRTNHNNKYYSNNNFHRRNQEQRRGRSQSRYSPARNRSNSNSHGSKNYNRSQSPHYPQFQRGPENISGRGRGRNQGHGNRGPRR